MTDGSELPLTSPGPKSPLNVLIVDDEANIRRTLTIALEIEGHQATAVGNAEDALPEAGRKSFDLAFVDLRLGTGLGLDLITKLRSQSPWTTVVVITAYGSIETAVEAMKRGAADYITKPFTPAQVTAVTERVMRARALEREAAGVAGRAVEPDHDLLMESSSPAMQKAINVARQVAGSDAAVLIRGESGTGKGVLAKAIHGWSPRAAKPFAVVSCPSLSAPLLESELFGHAKGAFTGAVRDNVGRVAASEGGTLFLDEIGDLPPELQPKLLRFLQDRQFERVGESTVRRANVRVITATNVNLESAVAAGRFREDLLYRINVVQIDVPPLRERPDDLIPLAERMLTFFGRGRSVLGFTDEALAALRSYSWPGNIRELRNVLERAAILCKGDRIGVEQLPVAAPPERVEIRVGDRVSIDKLKEAHVRRVLATSKSLEEAARVLDIDTATLWRLRKRHGI